MNLIDLTEAQRQAVFAEGNVLVVAGAGTGKTRTVVSRCVRLLLEKNCPLDEVLMVTFTNAAAAEMRSRIRSELRRLQKASAGANLDRIRQQVLLLDKAHIGTLHSFCLTLVTQHSYELGIDPSMRVLDEKQTAPLLSQAFDSVFAPYYEGASDDAALVRKVISELGRGHEEAIRRLILKLFRYSQAQILPERWLQQQEQLCRENKPRAWEEWFRAGFEQWRQTWLEELEGHCKIPTVSLCLRELKALPQGASLTEVTKTLDRFHAHWPKGSKLKFRRFREDLDFLSSLAPLAAGENPVLQDWNWVRPQVLTLLRLTREFAQAFTKAKEAVGGVDFADLEHLALRVLLGQDGTPSAVAKQWQNRLQFIFVDECQDINRAQDAIIAAVSRKAPNRFLVGDVKQSIYRFRQAEPKIFCGYEELWGGGGNHGSRIALADNFRSDGSILQFVNGLFSRLMRASVGGVAYQADSHLKLGKARGGQSERNCIELHLIDNRSAPTDVGGYSDSEAELLDLTNTEREARLVAKRLLALKNEGLIIWDAEEERSRPVEWRDMVVLMRSPRNRVEAFAKEFYRLGVPFAAARSGFFNAIEVSDLLNLLRLLDNPLQDVPLVAVLRSPLVGLSLEELAQIRIHSNERPFWSAVVRFHKDHDSKNLPPAIAPGWKKLDEFLRNFRSWRESSRQHALSVVLESVLAATHYEESLLAQPRGHECVANIARLLSLARQYDPYQRQGLYRFLRFVETQEEEQVEHEPALAPGTNAVRLMSIHRSKGLEFPVVVVAGLGTAFNFRGLYSDIVIHDRYGICPKVRPPAAEQSYPTLAHWLGQQAERRETLGEELRLLYVALTRARERLLLTGVVPKPDWRQSDLTTLTDQMLLSARSAYEWLRPWLASVTQKSDWLNNSEGGSDLLRWKVYAADSPELHVGSVAETPAPQVDGELNVADFMRFQQRILWTYPFTAATAEPAVKRVSQVIWTTDGDEEQLVFPYSKPPPQPRPLHRRSGALSAADIGSAHHLYLETVPLDAVGSIAELHAHALKLVSQGALSQEEADSLNLPAMVNFWQSEVGAMIRAQAANVQREVPFTARFTPQDLEQFGVCPNAAALGSEYFVARGAIDLLVLLPKEIWMLDFKTDVSEADLNSKTQIYSRQLQLYALAISRIYKRPVTNKWLHFLALNKTVSI